VEREEIANILISEGKLNIIIKNKSKTIDDLKDMLQRETD